ncbi:MAG: GFA family protein [Gaiellales bacterium]|jgi:hypothetical protein
MAIREAACSCGQLRLRAEGDPFHVGLCHCLACQRRTGSAFGMQAGFKAGQVTISGRHAEYPRISDEADRKVHVFHFCRDCGGTVFYTEPDERDLVVVMVGAFADPGFPPPMSSGYHARKHEWFGLSDSIETDDLWAELHPLYEGGGYAAAACSCGQLQLRVEGDPVRVSICHCLACQRRTGSAFGYQARFPAGRVTVTGRHSEYVRHPDDGGEERRFRFCPDCGSTVFYSTGNDPDLIAVAVGGFADPAFPPPTVAVYESRRHSWLELPAEIERDDVWEELLPLYEAGDYEAVADRGKQLVEAHPTYAELAYNVACCESLAGRADDAIAHLRLALEREESLRPQAAVDSDLDAIRDRRAFRDLIGQPV